MWLSNACGGSKNVSFIRYIDITKSNIIIIKGVKVIIVRTKNCSRLVLIIL